MAHFMDYIDEPAVIRREPAFIHARERLAHELTLTPEEKLGDSLDELLFRHMRPAFVHILLLNSDESEKGELEGLIDLTIKAPFSYSKGKILTPRDMRADATAREDDLVQWLGIEWSEEMLSTLLPEERIAAIRHAYSCRSRSLYKKIADGHPDMLELQERFDALESRCATAVRRIRNTAG